MRILPKDLGHPSTEHSQSSGTLCHCILKQCPPAVSWSGKRAHEVFEISQVNTSIAR